MFQIRTIGLFIISLFTITIHAMEVPENPAILAEILSGQVQTRELNLRPYDTGVLTELKQYLEQQGLTQSGNFRLLYNALEKELTNRTQATLPSIMQALYLVPTEQSELYQLGLCPLFPRERIIIVDGERYGIDLDFYYTELKTWERKSKKPSLGCPVINIGGSRYLSQLRTLDQDEVEATVSNCAALAINNAILFGLYAKTGNKDYLYHINNVERAQSFLEQYGCAQTTGRNRLQDVTRLENAINIIIQDFNVINKGDIEVLENILMLDADNSTIFGGSEKELKKIENLKQKIRSGLKQQYFFQALIIGSGDTAQFIQGGVGHYFTFVIIKANNRTEYIIVDTLPTNYYLSSVSYEYKKIRYLIDMLEKGTSNKLDISRDTPLVL